MHSYSESQQNAYDDLVKELQYLIGCDDVKNCIDQNLEKRVQSVLNICETEENTILKQKINQVPSVQKDLKQTTKKNKTLQKNKSLGNIKNKFISKELLMLPKYYEKETSRAQSKKSLFESQSRKKINRSASVRSGISLNQKKQMVHKRQNQNKENTSKGRFKTQSILSTEEKYIKEMEHSLEKTPELFAQSLILEDEKKGFGKEYEALGMIRKKEQAILQDKEELETKILDLKFYIQQEKGRIEKINQEISVMNNNLSELSCQCQQLHQQKSTTSKKVTELATETKKIQGIVSNTLSQNEQVNSGVEEERQLQLMYGRVIEQLKAQIKIEKHQRDKVKKQVRVLKKVEEASKNKFTRVNSSTSGIFHQVKSSIERWN